MLSGGSVYAGPRVRVRRGWRGMFPRKAGRISTKIGIVEAGAEVGLSIR